MADSPPIPAGMVPSVAPDGTPIYVPKARVAENVANGGRVMSAAEAAETKDRIDLAAKYDPSIHPLDAYGALYGEGATSILSGVTAGASDVAIGKLLGPGATAQVNEWRRAHPLLSEAHKGLGFLEGTLAAGALTGGAGAGVAAGEGVGLAGRIAAGAARGAAEMGVYESGQEFGRQALAGEALDTSKAAGAGVRGAAAGAVAGGAFSALAEGVGAAMRARAPITEAQLSNHALTGEALVAGAGRDVRLAAEEGASVLRPPAPKAGAFDSLAEKAYGEAAPGVGERMAGEVAEGANASRKGAYDAVADAYAGARPDREAASKLREAWANRTKVLAKHEETVEDASRKFSGALNDALAAGRKVDMASHGEAKIGQMAKLVDSSKFAEQSAAARAWAEEAIGTIKELATNPTYGVSPTSVKKWGGYMQRLDKALASGDGVKLFSELDEVKRFLGKEAEFGKGPFGLSTAAKEFDALYQGENGLQKVLEGDIWGKAGVAQREINASTAQMIGQGKLFTRKFTTEFGSELGRPTYAADTSAVSGFFNRLTSAANDLDAKAVDTWIGARKSYLDALSRNYTFDAATAKAVEKERSALGVLAKTHEQTTKDVALANQVKQALDQERAKGIGGLVGLATDVASKPYTMLERLASLEQTTKNIAKHVEAGAKSLSGEKLQGLAPPKAGGGGFFSGLLGGATPAAPASKVAGAGAKAEYAKTAQQVTALASNPALVADRVAKSLGPSTEGAPKVTAAATATAMRGVEFLAAKLAPPRRDPYTLQPQLQPPTRASDAEAAKFMRYKQAVDNPVMVLAEAKNGTLSRDHVEAVKEVYPEIYATMQQQVMQSMVASKKELPYTRRIQLGILLDIPTDKTLSPEFISAVQATYAPSEKAGNDAPPPTLSKPIHVSAPMMTATQSATQEGTEK